MEGAEKIIPNALKRRYQLLMTKQLAGGYKLTAKDKKFIKDYNDKFK